MAQADDKKKPIEERIAALIGKSAYVDIRDGLGGTCPLRIRDQDIAAALGWVSQKVGKLGPMVLETYYGSSLLHMKPLQTAWEDRERVRGESIQALSLTRWAGVLSVRRLAGASYNTSDLADYAHLAVIRRETLQFRVRDASSWLDGIRDTALGELKMALREIWEDRAKEAA